MSTTSASSREGSSNRNRNNRRRSGGQGNGRSGGNRNRNNNQSRNNGGGQRRNRRRRSQPPKPKTFGEKMTAFFKKLLGIESKPKLGRQPQQKRKPKPSDDRKQQAQKSETRPKQRKSDKPKRTPVPVEITSERLYVGNLNYEVSEGDLYDLFSGAGKVQNAEVVCHRHTQRSKGYAFVEMTTIDEARRAAEKLHDQDFMGRKLAVTGAKSGGPKGKAEAAPEEKASESVDVEESSSDEQEAA